MSGKASTVTSTGKTSTTHKPASTSSSRSQIGGSPQRQQQQHAQTQQEKKHHEASLTDRTRPQASTKESQRIPRSVPSKGSEAKADQDPSDDVRVNYARFYPFNTKADEWNKIMSTVNLPASAKKPQVNQPHTKK